MSQLKARNPRKFSIKSSIIEKIDTLFKVQLSNPNVLLVTWDGVKPKNAEKFVKIASISYRPYDMAHMIWFISNRIDIKYCHIARSISYVYYDTYIM